MAKTGVLRRKTSDQGPPPSPSRATLDSAQNDPRSSSPAASQNGAASPSRRRRNRMGMPNIMPKSMSVPDLKKMKGSVASYGRRLNERAGPERLRDKARSRRMKKNPDYLYAEQNLHEASQGIPPELWTSRVNAANAAVAARAEKEEKKRQRKERMPKLGLGTSGLGFGRGRRGTGGENDAPVAPRIKKSKTMAGKALGQLSQMVKLPKTRRGKRNAGSDDEGQELHQQQLQPPSSSPSPSSLERGEDNNNISGSSNSHQTINPKGSKKDKGGNVQAKPSSPFGEYDAHAARNPPRGFDNLNDRSLRDIERYGGSFSLPGNLDTTFPPASATTPKGGVRPSTPMPPLQGLTSRDQPRGAARFRKEESRLDLSGSDSSVPSGRYGYVPYQEQRGAFSNPENGGAVSGIEYTSSSSSGGVSRGSGRRRKKNYQGAASPVGFISEDDRGGGDIPNHAGTESSSTMSSISRFMNSDNSAGTGSGRGSGNGSAKDKRVSAATFGTRAPPAGKVSPLPIMDNNSSEPPAQGAVSGSTSSGTRRKKKEKRDRLGREIPDADDPSGSELSGGDGFGYDGNVSEEEKLRKLEKWREWQERKRHAALTEKD